MAGNFNVDIAAAQGQIDQLPKVISELSDLAGKMAGHATMLKDAWKGANGEKMAADVTLMQKATENAQNSLNLFHQDMQRALSLLQQSQTASAVSGF